MNMPHQGDRSERSDDQEILEGPMGAKFTIESVCQCRLFAKGAMIMVRQLGDGFHGVRLVGALAGVIVLLSGWLSGPALAASAKEIDAGAGEAIVKFEEEVKDGKNVLASSKGVLVFPRVLKGGAGFGGEYGEGALRVAGKTADYYSMLQGSFGLQLGGEIKTVIIVFLQEEALKQFRASEGWKAGVDGSVSLATLGTGGTIDTQTLKEPIVAFVLGQKGLMYNLSFEGTKFTKQKKA
ncbi:MAG TPA: YSC84-related protein [Nitrospiraceae bacterium]|nr:YSC84-related protein [Nitrospiraceae bacterium]